MKHNELYDKWLSYEALDEQTRAELESICKDEDEIKFRFRGNMEFGTAGLRGIMCAGQSCINTYTIAHATQGLSNLIIDENKCERGYDYAYTYPGMNHVLQAAGRVIRREEDRGVVVLIDDRYTAEPHLHLYPAHWEGIVAAGDAASLAHRCKKFWDKEN